MAMNVVASLGQALLAGSESVLEEKYDLVPSEADPIFWVLVPVCDWDQKPEASTKTSLHQWCLGMERATGAPRFTKEIR